MSPRIARLLSTVAVAVTLVSCASGTAAPSPSSTSSSSTSSTSTSTTAPAGTTSTEAPTVDEVVSEDEAAAAVEATVPAVNGLKVGQLGMVTVGSMSAPLIADADDNTAAGSDVRELARGVLKWKSGFMDCTAGTVLLGHRTSSPEPFANIDDVKVGDKIVEASNDGSLVCSWTIQSVELMQTADAISVMQNVTAGTAIASACAHDDGSPGGITSRWVVTATAG